MPSVGRGTNSPTNTFSASPLHVKVAMVTEGGRTRGGGGHGGAGILGGRLEVGGCGRLCPLRTLLVLENQIVRPLPYEGPHALEAHLKRHCHLVAGDVQDGEALRVWLRLLASTGAVGRKRKGAKGGGGGCLEGDCFIPQVNPTLHPAFLRLLHPQLSRPFSCRSHQPLYRRYKLSFS